VNHNCTSRTICGFLSVFFSDFCWCLSDFCWFLLMFEGFLLMLQVLSLHDVAKKKTYKYGIHKTLCERVWRLFHTLEWEDSFDIWHKWWLHSTHVCDICSSGHLHPANLQNTYTSLRHSLFVDFWAFFVEFEILLIFECFCWFVSVSCWIWVFFVDYWGFPLTFIDVECFWLIFACSVRTHDTQKKQNQQKRHTRNVVWAILKTFSYIHFSWKIALTFGAQMGIAFHNVLHNTHIHVCDMYSSGHVHPVNLKNTYTDTLCFTSTTLTSCSFLSVFWMIFADICCFWSFFVHYYWYLTVLSLIFVLFFYLKVFLVNFRLILLIFVEFWVFSIDSWMSFVDSEEFSLDFWVFWWSLLVVEYFQAFGGGGGFKNVLINIKEHLHCTFNVFKRNVNFRFIFCRNATVNANTLTQKKGALN